MRAGYCWHSTGSEELLKFILKINLIRCPFICCPFFQILDNNNNNNNSNINTKLMSFGDSLISSGEGSSLALVGNPSRDGVSIKMSELCIVMR